MRAKTFITCLFFTVAMLAAAAQSAGNNIANGDSVNRVDDNNQKQGWWRIYNTDGKYKGYGPGQLVEEGEYVNNRKTGVWTKYYPNGNKKHELTFANNIANGYAKIYYRNGQLQEEGVWKMNRWQGQYRYYYPDGTLKYEWNYNGSGKREGEQKYFHENGMLMYHGTWKNGNESGELIEYYPDGSIKAKRYFDDGKVNPEKTVNLPMGKEYDEKPSIYNGKPKPRNLSQGEIVDGYNKLMNRDGTVSKEGVFKDKMLVDGKVYVYENGRLVKVMVYLGGKKIGEETITDPD